MVDLKRVLMELGNKLVLEKGYDPSGTVLHPSVATNCAAWKKTDLIAALTDFINRSPEACEALRELGFEWSLTPQQLESQSKHPYMR